LGDYKPIVYLNINPAEPAPGLYGIHPPAHFLGMINPPLMLLAVPALLLAGWRWWRRAEVRAPGRELDTLALAWFLGTFLPFEVLSLGWDRTSYLYYMVVVMPGIYLAVASLLQRVRARRRLILVWAALLVAGAVVMFPFTPVP
jgi:hypothetical protein